METRARKDQINFKKSLFQSKSFIELQELATETSDIISIRKKTCMVISQWNSIIQASAQILIAKF